MGFWNWLRGVRQQEAPSTRLSAEQAIQIARAAVEEVSTRELLTMTRVDDRDGTLIWTVSQAVMGRATHVEVDDASGQVLRIYASGIR
jgi:uncharacterized membrane protein YkoI